MKIGQQNTTIAITNNIFKAAMSARNDYECLDEEIRELLQNYHLRRDTNVKFCTEDNFKECLIGLLKELDCLNIDNVFNPYCDVVGQTLQPEALVKLINSFWMLIQLHKSTNEKAANLVKENQAQVNFNKQLNGLIDKLREEVNNVKNQNKKCFATLQQLTSHFDASGKKLDGLEARVKKVSKEKDTVKKNLTNEINRMKTEIEKLTDRQRCKSGIFTPCSEACQSTISQLKQQERQHLATIAKLQQNNAILLKEVLDIKEKLILSATK